MIGTYSYDADGKRIKKVTATETTTFVYSGGKLVAEYLLTNSTPTTPTTQYLTTDMLGSPRVISDQSGNIVSRRDFMPFGEEIQGLGNRTTTVGYNPDTIRQKFTGYEKDDETGLDFAEARYYNSRNGRFTAVDPLLASGKSAHPQTFNRYSYTMNNPLVMTDPTGMQTGLTLCQEGKPCNSAGTYDSKTNTATYNQSNSVLGVVNSTIDSISTAITTTIGALGTSFIDMSVNSDPLENANQQRFENGLNVLNGDEDADEALNRRLIGNQGPSVDSVVQGATDAKAWGAFIGNTGIGINLALLTFNPAQFAGSSPSVTTNLGTPLKFNGPPIPPIIYRQNGTSPSNLTPRAKDNGLLSFRDSISNPYPLPSAQNGRPVMEPGKEFHGYSTKGIPPSNFVFDEIPGHVMLKNVSPQQLKSADVYKGKFPK